MPRIIYTEPFLDEMAHVTSDRIRNKIFDSIDKLPSVPNLGSQNLPQAIIDKHGNLVRKIVVRPFLVIYKELENGDFLVLGLMYGRAAY